MSELLLGDEAIAQAALDADIAGVYAYPGTPSTEITEYIQKAKHVQKLPIHASWCTNEKTAYEAALGVSYAGKRALVCMKHVGLNVAADAFINSAVTGTNGGLVLVSADDPSMHSSQDEQDSRFYAKFAMIPVLEPSNQQEAYDAVRYAFDLSEEVKLPVMLRITTRLAHSRAGVVTKPKVQVSPKPLPSSISQFVLLPVNARKQYKLLLSLQPKLLELAETSSYNILEDGTDTSLGIIACGIAYNYVKENTEKFGLKYPILKISQYPFPEKSAKDLIDRCKRVLIFEEGYPIYEELLRGLLNREQKISGRLDGTLPRDGELNPDIVAAALNHPQQSSFATPELLAGRPPQLCNGCSHRDVYEALNESLKDVKEKHVFSDIGCYTLGALPPFNAINTCVDMGASITMAKGAADAGLRPAVAVIGDSTFTHSGITGLLDAVNDNSPLTVIISDNDTTAMTGGQDSPGNGKLFNICKGIGVKEEHIVKLLPHRNQLEKNVAVMKQEFAYEGVSVIIANRECIQTASRKKKK
ncbi:MAG TPA: indolepyruvate ferredoxin oxidoreductase subunit alpha [Bacteroidota bacterium]|nr:indolepyruvate ferredoxin oxidoreductase subunit alpha [Bacteroidota bacterium]